MSVAEQYNLILDRLTRVNGFASPAQLTKFLSISIQDFDLIFKTEKSDKVDLNMVCIGGHYDPQEDEGLFPCIEIDVFYNPAQKQLITANIEPERVLVELFATIIHEKVHQNQYRNRNFANGKHYHSKNKDPETKREQDYLGSIDEIEAYGAEVAVDLYLNGLYNDKDVIQQHTTYKHYETVFGHGHKVLHKLEEEIVKYINILTKEPYHVLY